MKTLMNCHKYIEQNYITFPILTDTYSVVLCAPIISIMNSFSEAIKIT